MDQKRPLISIITVVFNGADYLEQAILSVVNQGYENIEYIVIDGGSTDGTLDIIQRYRDKIAYFVSEPDEGIFNAMNKGVAQTNGDFIGILNADDWYEPGIINRVVDKINESQETPPGPDVIYFDYYHFDEELSSHRKVKRYSTLAYWRGMSISHQAMFVSKGVYEKFIGYEEHYRLAADYEFFLRMVMLGKKFVKLHTHGVTFRRGGHSTMNMNASIQEASKINWLYFGRFSPKHFLFILHNHVPSILGNIKLLLYKWIGRGKTAKLRRLWKRLKGSRE